MINDTEINPFELVNAETGETAKLAMQGLWLTGRILPVGAHLVAVHTFRSAEPGPLEVVYSFGLPRDAALRRFKIVGENFQVRSELRPLRDAQAQYEQAIAEGHLSSLARTYRDGRVNLSVGNIRPGEMVKVFLELVAGVEIQDDGLRFRFPFTLAPCYHAQARAVELVPGAGELELPSDQFGDLLLPTYLTDPGKLHGVAFDLGVALGENVASISSPSHSVRVSGLGGGAVRVGLATGKDVPDRDLVLEVRAAAAQPRVCGGVCPEGKSRFSVVVPSANFGAKPDSAKSVIFVLDRSGSMQGPAMAQAKKAVAACLATLSERDSFGLIAFDDSVVMFQNQLQHGTMASRKQALKFLDGVDAQGGTEIASAIAAGIQLGRRACSDLFVVTDGQVSATEDIIQQYRVAGVRIHCLGIGAASQDRFLTLLARETGGQSRFLTPRERVDMGALDLFASLGCPLASGITGRFSGLPGARAVGEPVTAVHERQPFVLMAEADGAGTGALEIAWDNQTLKIPLSLAPNRDAETVGLLQGARLITDFDVQMAGEAGKPDQDSRVQARIESKLMHLSQTYGLASRVMALVAVVERAGDDDTKIPKTMVVPVGLPQDLAMESYFGGHIGSAAPAVRYLCQRVENFNTSYQMAPSSGKFQKSPASWARFLRKHQASTPMLCESLAEDRGDSPEDQLMSLAGELLPDGGLPGKSDDERLFKSALLLYCFLGCGHTCQRGAFRRHVERLADFLDGQLANAGERSLLQALIDRAELGQPMEEPANLADLLALCDSQSHTAAWADLRTAMAIA